MSDFKNKLMSMIQRHNPEVGELGNAEIPPIIHRIWLGEAMRKHTFETLMHFQEHITETGTSYIHALWVHSAEDAGLKSQLHDLHEAGMMIRDMAQVWDSCPKIGQTIKECMGNEAGDYTDYKKASDIFRMFILYTEGGIYMDADIGVREELFDEPLFHRFRFEDGAYMPLLGSMAPYANLYEQAGRDIEAYLAQEYAAYLSNEYGWNYFFASVPGNPVIGQMLQDVCSKDGQTMTCNLISRFYAEIQGEERETNRKALFDFAFAPLDLQYYTEASIES